MAILINGQRFEVAPDVQAYINDMKKLTQEYYSEITKLRVKNYRLRNINEELTIATNGYMKLIQKHYYPLNEKNEKLRALVAKCARHICKHTIDVVAYPEPNPNAGCVPTLFGYDLRELLGDDWKKQIFGECEK